MTRIEPLTDEEMGDSIELLRPTIERLGFLPNSQRIMARKPELLAGINELYKAIMHRTEESLSPGLLYLVGNASSLAAGCMYCVAHSAGAANHSGEESAKIAAIWDFESSDLFTEAERAALRFAQAASSVPNMVTDKDFDALKEHYSEYQIVELLSIIGLYGFFNRWNDTLSTPLEKGPTAFAEKAIGDQGWTAGKHVAK
ncbi:MAG: carboxymuconolactone decarboxylase family protein [Pseudomonadota bacterium]|nr:carboxymuconolactone decarboxylase family protein [Pseudomonadota bacterium]